MVNVKLQWYTGEVSDLASSCEEDELFVSSQLQSFREQLQEHVSDHGVEGIGAYAVLANSVCENLETTSKDDSHFHRVSETSSPQRFAKVQQ